MGIIVNTASEIAEIISGMVKKRGITINKMLSECKLSKKTIDNMKTNSMPAADKLAIISQYLGTSIEYLLGLSDNPLSSIPLETNKSELNNDEQEIINIYKNLDRRGQHAMHTKAYDEQDRMKNEHQKFHKFDAEIANELVNKVEMDIKNINKTKTMG